MTIKIELNSLDDVDARYHDLYTKDGDIYRLTGVEGLKTQRDIDKLQSSLVKERNDHKETKAKYSVFHDMDLEEVQTKLDRYAELEEAAKGKLDEAGIQKLVENRLNSTTAPLKRELDKYKAELSEREKKLEEYTTKERQRTISDAVRSAALRMKIQETAIDDALLLAERTFEIDESGTVITKDGLGPEVWLTDMQSKRPHWWQPSSGGGANGTKQGSMSNNPWSANNWNMTEQGKIYMQDPSKAEQLAKMAGTTIGGTPPPQKQG